jgi:hypothetical protein
VGLASRHYHVGDLWAFALVALIGIGWNKFKLNNWLMIGLGSVFLVISNSRSALLSLALGLGYLFEKQINPSKTKNTIKIFFFALLAGIFVFSSVGKTTLFDRPYFLQSIESFAKYPLGIGIGNFDRVSEVLQSENITNTSIYTHNIFLEALSGVGIFAVIFLVLLTYLVWDILKYKGKGSVWGAFIVAMLTNFMFDTTYAIPGLVWILFMSIGVFQSQYLLRRDLTN